MDDFSPAEVFAPGEYLKDALELRGWTQTEFAEIIGRPTRVINEIIAGKRSVTPETARELAAGLNTSAQYWLNLEAAYQLSKTPEPAKQIGQVAILRARFPVREMIKRGWIATSDNIANVEKSVFDYFGIKAVNDAISFSHAARRNHNDDISELQWAWIFRVKKIAEAMQVPAYSQSALSSSLNELERLMMEPEEIRKVPRILAECGVRFVVVEPIPGSKVHGVCFWLEGKSPVIGLTLKHDYIDRIWFNLRHEIEHVLRGDGKDNFISDSFEDVSEGDEDECERHANAVAAEFCVPQDKLDNFIARHDPMYSTIKLVGFSKLVKRHPGIVAGQLQRKIGRNNLFNKYQVRVREMLIAAAMTDGYGRSLPINL